LKITPADLLYIWCAAFAGGNRGSQTLPPPAGFDSLSSAAPPARNILVNFVEGRVLAAQAMALDHRTSRCEK